MDLSRQRPSPPTTRLRSRWAGLYVTSWAFDGIGQVPPAIWGLGEREGGPYPANTFCDKRNIKGRITEQDTFSEYILRVTSISEEGVVNGGVVRALGREED